MEIRLRNNLTNAVELTATDALHVEFAGDLAHPGEQRGQRVGARLVPEVLPQRLGDRPSRYPPGR